MTGPDTSNTDQQIPAQQLPVFQQAQVQMLGDLPMSSLVGGPGAHLPTGSIAISHASPPILAKLVWEYGEGSMLTSTTSSRMSYEHPSSH